MLAHSECGGPAVIDQSRYPIAIGNDIWVFIKCLWCGQHIGTVANVEDKLTWEDKLAQSNRSY